MPKRYTDDKGRQLIEFAEGEGPTVMRGISPQCNSNDCPDCPGIGHPEELGGKAIACIHECHRAENNDANLDEALEERI